MSPPRKRPGRPTPAAKKAAKSPQPAKKAAKSPQPAKKATRSPGRSTTVPRALVDHLLAQLERRAGRPDDPETVRIRRQLMEVIAAADAGAGDDDEAWSDDEEWDSAGEDGGARRGGWHDDGDEDDQGTWDPWAERQWWRELAPSKPIPVEGGLTARSKRGAIGETWWSQRFLAAVEAVMEGGRSSRGRSYARKGQVVDLSLGAGLIEAHVQGSRTTPYRVRLSLPVVPDPDWDRIVAALAAEAGYAARLLAGDLPYEIEDVFAAEGASLFPSATARLTTECSCPDWSNPCKHVAAVCYLVAEAFDRDPFAVLAWRGRTRDELLDRLRALRGVPPGPEPDAADAPAEPAAAAEHAAAAEPAAPPVTAPPLAECLASFWAAGPELADVRMRPEASALPGAVLRHLTPGLLEVGGRDVGELLEPAYADLATAAAQRALATGEPPPRPARRSPRSSGRRSAR